MCTPFAYNRQQLNTKSKEETITPLLVTIPAVYMTLRCFYHFKRYVPIIMINLIGLIKAVFYQRLRVYIQQSVCTASIVAAERRILQHLWLIIWCIYRTADNILKGWETLTLSIQYTLCRTPPCEGISGISVKVVSQI